VEFGPVVFPSTRGPMRGSRTRAAGALASAKGRACEPLPYEELLVCLAEAAWSPTRWPAGGVALGFHLSSFEPRRRAGNPWKRAALTGLDAERAGRGPRASPGGCDGSTPPCPTGGTRPSRSRRWPILQCRHPVPAESPGGSLSPTEQWAAGGRCRRESSHPFTRSRSPRRHPVPQSAFLSRAWAAVAAAGVGHGMPESVSSMR
jgi:hypothetical protein